jgi:hypothetical protein
MKTKEKGSTHHKSPSNMLDCIACYVSTEIKIIWKDSGNSFRLL